MVFKKDLTPLRKGGPVIKHRGKGSSEFKGGDRFGQAMNRYPKPNPAPEPSARNGVTSGPTELGLGNAFEFDRKP